MLRKFAIVQRPGCYEWSADYVRAVLDRRMLTEQLTEKDVEEQADRLGCRIVWAGPDGKIKI